MTDFGVQWSTIIMKAAYVSLWLQSNYSLVWGFVDIGKYKMSPRLIFIMCNNNSRLAFIHMQTSSIYILTDDLPEVK